MNSADETCDVAIVGGGPAGAAAAFVLARAGVRAVVFERAPMPRDKVCGDLLGTEAIATVRRIGFPDRVLAGAMPLAGAVLHGPRGATYGAIERDSRDPDARAARVIPRERFDSALLNESARAGAVIRTERVIDIVRGDAISIRSATSNTRARIVIGADGWGSLTARTLVPETMPASDVAVAVRGYARGVRGLDRRMHFFVNDVRDGYGWIFPLADGGANVGLGFIRSEGAFDLHGAFARFRAPGSNAHAFLGESSFANVAAWPIPIGPRTRAVTASGVFLAGDAAGLASPLSGSGIHHALASGAMAARCALRVLADDGAGYRSYARWIARRLTTRLRVESFVHRAFATATTVDRYAAIARLPGCGRILSRAMLALG